MTDALPECLLFVTPDCPHCATVQRELEGLQQQGMTSGVVVVDASRQPELAAQHGVRSVPWLKLGPYTLIGVQSPTELRQWADWAHGDVGAAHYVAHLLDSGNFAQASAFVHADAGRLQPLLTIVADPDEKLAVRLGVSALFESYAGTPTLQSLLLQLSELCRHADHRVRADACFLLGLTGSAQAGSAIERCLADDNAEVREIAAEALQMLAGAGAKPKLNSFRAGR